jgi:hypothetical protein
MNAMNRSLDVTCCQTISEEYTFGDMLQTLSYIDCDASRNRFDPQPFSISTQHLQSQDILFEQQCQGSEIRVSANIVRLRSRVISSAARAIQHPSNKVFRREIVIVHLEKIIFGKFENKSMEDKESAGDVHVHLSTERTNLVPPSSKERMSWTMRILDAILMDLVLL